MSNLGARRGILGYGVVVWGIRSMAYWVYTTSSNPILGGIRIADSNIGVLWSNVGPDPVGHILDPNRVTILESVFIGRSYSNAGCGKRTAIMMPVSTSEGLSLSPGICGDIGGPHLKGIWGFTMGGGSYPSLLAETRLTGNTFLRYFPDACGTANVLETLMEGGQNSADGVPPIFARRTTIDDLSRANLAYLKPPMRDWIIPAKCGVMDCDGPKQQFIHDLDGTLTGLQARSSILARSDFMNEYRANGDFTWYNIPTKMLYDPCPLVRGLETNSGAELPAHLAGCRRCAEHCPHYSWRCLHSGMNSELPFQHLTCVTGSCMRAEQPEPSGMGHIPASRDARRGRGRVHLPPPGRAARH